MSEIVFTLRRVESLDQCRIILHNESHMHRVHALRMRKSSIKHYVQVNDNSPAAAAFEQFAFLSLACEKEGKLSPLHFYLSSGICVPRKICLYLYTFKQNK